MSAGRRAAVLTCSTRAAAGTYADECGPILADWLRAGGYTVTSRIAADGPDVRQAMAELLEGRPSVLITTGGTGLSIDDLTPEITDELLERRLPGVSESIRRAGEAATPLASLSRGVAGAAGETFIVNLPGSPGGVRDGLAVLGPILDHICEQLEGSHVH